MTVTPSLVSVNGYPDPGRAFSLLTTAHITCVVFKTRYRGQRAANGFGTPLVTQQFLPLLKTWAEHAQSTVKALCAFHGRGPSISTRKAKFVGILASRHADPGDGEE